MAYKDHCLHIGSMQAKTFMGLFILFEIFVILESVSLIVCPVVPQCALLSLSLNSVPLINKMHCLRNSAKY